jgi:hypothetical protein
MSRTLAQFIKQSSIPAALIRATVRQFGGFDNFKESAPDVTNHGIDGGFRSFIYYADTCAFYARNQKLIAELAESMAEMFGQSATGMIEGFNCLNGDYSEGEVGRTLYGPKRQHDTQIANALAWFAAEEVARAYCDYLEAR